MTVKQGRKLSTGPTIRQVAKACGVAPITVSAVLNNKPGQVGVETRQRVLKTVREMGYRPSVMSAMPAERKLYTLGVVSGSKGDTLVKPGFFHSVLSGILQAADRTGNNVMVFNCDIFHNDTRNSIRVYCDGRSDGLLVMGLSPNSQLIVALQERGIPFVVIGDNLGTHSISYVDVDNVTVGRMATECLLSAGHRRIAFAGGPWGVRSKDERLLGYRKALAAFGIEPDPVLEYDGDPAEIAEIHDHTMQSMELFANIKVGYLLSLPEDKRPTAIYCWQDPTAVFLMKALQAAGYEIPGDFSVVGSDDHIMASLADPPLTTVGIPYSRLSDIGVDMLLEAIQEPSITPHGVLLTPELVTRESVRTLDSIPAA